MIEVAVQGTEDLRAANDRGVHYVVVIGIRWDHPRRWTWEHHLGNVLPTEVPTIVGDFLIGEFRRSSNAAIR